MQKSFKFYLKFQNGLKQNISIVKSILYSFGGEALLSSIIIKEIDEGIEIKSINDNKKDKSILQAEVALILTGEYNLQKFQYVSLN